MPTTRRRTPRGRLSAGGITHTDFIYFTWGSFFEAEDYEIGKTEEELKAFWMKHRAAIMDQYLEANLAKKLFGDRPWPFWKWEMTEPRRKIGRQSYFKPYPDRTEHFEDVLEDDFQYLERLGLLQDWEKVGKGSTPDRGRHGSELKQQTKKKGKEDIT